MRFEAATENMKSYSNELKQSLSEFESYVKEVNSNVEIINSYWVGHDATKLINRMNNFVNRELTKLVQTLTEYSDYLSKAADTYDALDEAYASKRIDV